MKLIPAEVPQVDHRVGQYFESVMQLAETLEPKQQATELVFSAEHPLDRIEPVFEYGGIEEWLATALGSFSTARIGVNVGDHRAIENGFSVLPAIIDAIQANHRSSEIETNSTGDACHLRQGFAQQRRFIAIAGRRNKRCDHIAILIAEGDDLVPFHLLVA